MKKLIFTFITILITPFIAGYFCSAQPYVDLLNFRYTNSPDAGIVHHNKERVKLEYFNVGTTVPLQWKTSA